VSEAQNNCHADPVAAEPAGEGRIEAFRRMLEGNRMAFAGLVVFLAFFLTAFAGLFLTSGSDPVFDPAQVRLENKLRPPLSAPFAGTLEEDDRPPFGVFLLGTDDLGRDVFARMLQGAWVSLTVGFVAVGIAVAVGILLGGIAGYFGSNRVQVGEVLWACAWAGALLAFAQGAGRLALGLFFAGPVILLLRRLRFLRGPLRFLERGTFSVDTLVMRLVDIMLCFPSFFLILTVVALLPASMYNIMIVIGLTSWMGTARFVRAEFLSLREQDFVTAARALGIGTWRIIFRHMMPNAIAPVLVSATIGIATAILTEAGLSFLGFGVPPPHATWGNILSDGKNFIFDAPWLTFVPGVAILIVVLCFNLFGEGLREALNPKLRER